MFSEPYYYYIKRWRINSNLLRMRVQVTRFSEIFRKFLDFGHCPKPRNFPKISGQLSRNFPKIWPFWTKRISLFVSLSVNSRTWPLLYPGLPPPPRSIWILIIRPKRLKIEEFSENFVPPTTNHEFFEKFLENQRIFKKFRTTQRRSTNNQQRATSNQHPTTNNPQPPTNKRQPIPRPPTTDAEQPTTHNRPPATNTQQPTTHNQQPTTNNPQPTTHNRPLTNDNQQLDNPKPTRNNH